MPGLLKLSHRFDVHFLLRDCIDHLKHCYEKSIQQRLKLAQVYDLKGLIAYLDDGNNFL